MRSTSVIRYLSVAVIVIILAALSAWYFFIRAKQAAIEQADAGRGAGLSTQPPASPSGSTYENIVSSLSSVFTGGEINENTKEVPRLAQVNKSPTAGAGFVGSSTSTRLRFVERGTGFIFDIAPETLALERLTNVLVPRTYEALVAENDHLIMRGIEEDGNIVTVVASIVGTSTTENARALVQKRLPDGIRSIAIDPSGKEIFYIIGGVSGGVGTRAGWDGTKPKQIFSSAISGWQAYWLTGERFILVQKPTNSSAGYAYEVQKDGALSPLVRNAPGLTFLPHPSSRTLLYGASGGGLALFVRISGTSTTASLPIRTIADKCVWAPGPQLVAYCAVPQTQPSPGFLDQWHRGEVHTADAWWRVDASAASAELLFSPGNTTLDVENPLIDKQGEYIAFMNSIDKSLWLLRVAE